MTPAYDVMLAGGGLANGLIAWRLRTLRPGLRLLVLEGATGWAATTRGRSTTAMSMRRSARGWRR
ncbi:hypothetical protein [Pseudoduganella plicata]|uniref:hypothetical protein n=1 Tax=Pseudoduganella plicata TaxID=321984 RepID=UPI001E2B3196|nr:hypothetical protein [Pseudoduganella plicata]